MEGGRVRRELMFLYSQPQRASRCKLKTGVSQQVCVGERDCETHMYVLVGFSKSVMLRSPHLGTFKQETTAYYHKTCLRSCTGHTYLRDNKR